MAVIDDRRRVTNYRGYAFLTLSGVNASMWEDIVSVMSNGKSARRVALIEAHGHASYGDAFGTP